MVDFSAVCAVPNFVLKCFPWMKGEMLDQLIEKYCPHPCGSFSYNLNRSFESQVALGSVVQTSWVDAEIVFRMDHSVSMISPSIQPMPGINNGAYQAKHWG